MADSSASMEIRELIACPGGEWLDFKRQFHENRAKFLHDVLCLANSYSTLDRYLVFGVSDDGQLVGVDSDTNRRTNAQIHDLLRAARLSRIPTCSMASHTIDGVAIDVLTISNRPDKPFFVTSDYEYRGERIRNGVVYTRLGDTNIPMLESAPEDHVELMWRDRFGLGLSPLERAYSFLDDPAGWSKLDGDRYLYRSEFPEFTIVDGAGLRESFDEPWTQRYPESKAWSFEVQLRYHTTILERFTFVACDGGRYRIPLPEQRVIDGERRFFLARSTPGWRLGEIYKQYYPLEDDYALLGVEVVENQALIPGAS